MPIQEIVDKLNVPAFAVDEALRVVAWNGHAERGGSIPASEALGRFCFEVLPATDIETGRPCQETCPLLPESARQGWAHNRALRAPWKGSGWVRLQCFAIKTALPGSERCSICLLEPPEDHALEGQSRVLDLVEALYPALSARTPPLEAIAASLEALRRVARASCAELYLPVGEHWERVATAGDAPAAVGDGLVGAAARSLFAPPGGPPHLVIASHPESDVPGGAGFWSLCAPVVAQGRLAGILTLSSERESFEAAAAARVMFPLSVHLASYVAALGGPRAIPTRTGEPGRETSPLAPRLVVRCLGPLFISVEGEAVPVARFKRQKAVQAFAYLVAHRGRLVSREALMEVLWPGANPRQAGRNLRVILHDMRRALEPAGETRSSYVRNDGDMVVLDGSDRVWVDAEAFAKAARRAASLGQRGDDQAALAACHEAMALYQGDFLEDDPYADWALICREQFRELYLGVLKQTSVLLERSGRREEAIGLCRRALQVDRGREEFHRDLMRLFLATGRRDEALRQYQTCRRILRRELGTVPAPETEALFRSLSEAAPA